MDQSHLCLVTRGISEKVTDEMSAGRFRRYWRSLILQEILTQTLNIITVELSITGIRLRTSYPIELETNGLSQGKSRWNEGIISDGTLRLFGPLTGRRGDSKACTQTLQGTY